MQKQGDGVTYLIIPLAGVGLCVRTGADLGPSQSDGLQTERGMLRARRRIGPPPSVRLAGDSGEHLSPWQQRWAAEVCRKTAVWEMAEADGH